jgi:hypothetical protein
MSPSVHRKFLFEPNAADWTTSPRVASLELRLVRTGMWSAFRKIQLDPGPATRASCARSRLYLCARKARRDRDLQPVRVHAEPGAARTRSSTRAASRRSAPTCTRVAARMKDAKHFCST